MTRDDSLKKILSSVICMFVLSYALPSGMLFGFPVQKLLVVVILVCALLALVRQGVLMEIIRKSPYEILVAVAGLMWCATGWYRGFTWSLNVFILLYIGVVILLAVKYLLEYNLLDIESIMRCLLIMMLMKALVKLSIEIAFVAGILDYEGVSQFYFQVFSTEATTMTMDFGSVELVRIQDSSDAIVFTLMPFYWLAPQRKGRECVSLFLVMLIYAVIVFSRIYLVEFACFGLLTIIYYWKKIPRRQRAVGTGIVVVLAVILAGPVIEMLKFRFFSSFTVESDTTRTIQMAELWKGITENPWLGHGMGSYIPDYIRSETFPFSYEMEYMSFVYQMGLVGFVLVIGGIIGIYLKYIYPYFLRNSFIIKMVSVLGIGWFLVRPLFNPSFLGKQNQFLLIGIYLLNVWYCSMQKPESQKKGSSCTYV